MSRTRQWTAEAASIIFLLVLGLALGWPRFRSGIDLRDEGFLAYGAERVLEGQIPNRDFVSLQPPLSFYTGAAMFKLCGTSLWSLRLLGLALYLAIPILVYAIARQMAGPVLALASAVPATILGIPFFNFTPFAVWQGITATALAALLYLLAIEKNRSWLAWLAGMVTGASLLLRQDQGLYLVISILVYTVVSIKAEPEPLHQGAVQRLATLWLAGLALTLLLGAAYWGVQGALPDMFNQLVKQPMTIYAKTSSAPFPVFKARSSLAQNALVGLFYAAPLAIILTATRLLGRLCRHGWTCAQPKLMFAAAWAALFYGQALTRSDLSHFLITLVPFFVLCAWGWAALRPSRVASVAAAGAVAAFLIVARPAVFPDTAGEQPLNLPRAGLRIKDPTALTRLVQMAQDRVPPDRAILCLPYQPMFYFLCERHNPTRWNYLWPGDQTEEDHRELIAEARRDPPALVLLTGENQLRDYAPAIVDYIQSNDTKIARVGPVFLYAPK
jgi:hypothetical protein